MKVVFLAPGTGGTFYCQNCVRDTSLVRALRRLGHDMTLVPVYLPILIDDSGAQGDTPVFFGGINVYLQQKLSLFRQTPRWLDRVLDMQWLLKIAAKREGSTEASGLGPMTLSMLRGEQGNQRKELERMIDWLANHEKPDVIHISNSLMIGLARELKKRIGVRIVCSLQDEENWLNAIAEPYGSMCWDTMADRAADVDAFISVSEWYARRMSERMRLNGHAMRVVPVGIELDSRPPAELPFNPPVIGYLAKLCPSLGLGELVDAFIALKRDARFADLKLRATGGQHGPDIAFVKGLRRKIEKAGVEDDVDFMDEFDIEHRRDFLRSLTVLSVPSKEGEAFGMYILEALTEGVPVVQPRSGAYPEVIQKTGGGILYDPGDPDALTQALASVLSDPDTARRLGAQGRETVQNEFGVENMARGIAQVYESLL